MVGDKPIRAAALEQELARRHLSRPTTAEKAAALEDLIRFEVLYAQAQTSGFVELPKTQAAIKRLIVAQYRESLATNPISPASPAEVEQYYRTQTNLYQVPEQARVALILIAVSSNAPPERRAEARQKAEAIRAEVLAGGVAEPTFGALAQKNSAHQPSRYRGGDLGWLSRPAAAADFEPVLVDTMFGLNQPGELSPVVAAKEGFYLFKLIARKPASARPLAEVKEAIAYRIGREQAAREEESLYAQLKAGIPIQINQAALAAVMTNPPPIPSPPPLPSR